MTGRQPSARHRVLIVGGGIVGACSAYFLASDPAFAGQVTVLEQDPSYARAATTLSASSIRQQFSTAVNIRASRYGIEFLRHAPELLAVGGEPVSIGLHEHTYLYLATALGTDTLQANAALQRSLGVAVEVLDIGALAAWLPWLSTAGLALATRTRDGEGWFDAAALLAAVRRKAISLGVTFLKARAEALLSARSGTVDRVRLMDGSDLRADWVICAAGTRTAGLLGPLGLDVPVRPRKRAVFVFASPAATPGCPLIVDPSGFWVRPEGKGYICGTTPVPDPPVDPDDFEPDSTSFEDSLWPLLAARIPGFEAARSTRSWVGHYDYNDFDQNAFVGAVPVAANLLIACGFSGHGLQQAPAVGRGLAELVIHGGFRSLDLAPLAYDRYLRGARLPEANVI